MEPSNQPLQTVRMNKLMVNGEAKTIGGQGKKLMIVDLVKPVLDTIRKVAGRPLANHILNE